MTRRQLEQAKRVLAETRRAHHAAIARELASGTTQADVARLTGYTREQVRRIARAAGIGPAR